MQFNTVKKFPSRIKTRLNHRFGVRPLAMTQAEIQAWFQNPTGQRLLEAEQIKLDRIMPELCGYHLMQLSSAGVDYDLSRQSPITHHFSLGVGHENYSSVQGAFENLPIESESIDVAVLHHALEYSTNPHQLLREAARTVIPNGYLVIVGFNPWNMMNNCRQIGRLFSRNPQRRFHPMRRSRLIDWLKLLDFEPAYLEYGTHRSSIKNAIGQKVEKMFTQMFPVYGSFYLIVARKSIHAMTLIKPKWKTSPVMSAWAKNPSAQKLGSAAKQSLLHQTTKPNKESQ